MSLPRLLRVRPADVARRDGLAALVSRVLRPAPPDLAYAVAAFEFKCDERDFARNLLSRYGNWWLYRCNQFAFCGDFVAVDLSPPDPDLRVARVLDLKRGVPLRPGGGIQMREAPAAVADLTTARVAGANYERWIGDKAEILSRITA